MLMSVLAVTKTTVTSPPELPVLTPLVHSPVNVNLDFLGMASQGLAKVRLLSLFKISVFV